MVKKIKCKIIESVSFSSDKSGKSADNDFGEVGLKSGLFASYGASLGFSGGDGEVVRERFNVLA